MRTQRYNDRTFAAAARRFPRYVVRDESGVQWMRGALSDDTEGAPDLETRWEYRVPRGRHDLEPAEGDWVHLPLDPRAPPLPFLVTDRRRASAR